MIVQFGTSRFLQAHVDLFAHEAREMGQVVPSIVVVQTTNDQSRAARLTGFTDGAGFPVIIRGIERGLAVERCIQVRSVSLGINAHRDWGKLVDLFVNKASYVVSNTGDNGFVIADEDRNEAVLRGKVPSSFPAILLALLYRRWVEGKEPITLLPCELIAGNGRMLQGLILQFAEKVGAEKQFLFWLASECNWANTLVDRIVSEPLHPAGAIAEPYALWAIEQQPGLSIPFTHQDVHLVADLDAYQRLKVHILNLGHSWLADRWDHDGQAPRVTVKQMLADPETRSALVRLYQEEVQPGFARRGLGTEAKEYIAQTFERFENPFLAHAVADIFENHAAKVRKRVGEFIYWVRSAPGQATSMPELEKLLASTR